MKIDLLQHRRQKAGLKWPEVSYMDLCKLQYAFNQHHKEFDGIIASAQG